MLSGVIPVVSTPFLSDDTVDIPALDAELRWLMDQGVHGLALAMVSEWMRLSDVERARVTEVASAAVAGRGTLVVSVGAESTNVAARQAKDAHTRGASAVMALPPALHTAGDQALIGYFSAIVEAAEVPVVIQDASSYIGRAVPVSVMAALGERYGFAHVLYKPESVPVGPRLAELLASTGGSARIFEGLGGGGLLEGFGRGVVGSMPGPEVPWAVVSLWESLLRGDVDRAERTHQALTALLAPQQTLEAFIAAEKHLLVRQGVLPSRRRRSPTDYVLDPVAEQHLDRMFDLLWAVVHGDEG